MLPRRLRADLKLIICCRTMISTNKLLTVKIERSFTKRKICLLADLAKLKKYKMRIDSVAVELEVRISLLWLFSFINSNGCTQHNASVNITQILLEVMAEDGRRSQSKGISIPEGGIIDDGRVKQGGKQRAGAFNGSTIAEDSRSPGPEVQKLTTTKHKFEEGEKEGDRPFGKQKKQVKQSSSLGNLNVTDMIKK